MFSIYDTFTISNPRLSECKDIVIIFLSLVGISLLSLSNQVCFKQQVRAKIFVVFLRSQRLENVFNNFCLSSGPETSCSNSNLRKAR